jgi:hypothetical protein
MARLPAAVQPVLRWREPTRAQWLVYVASCSLSLRCSSEWCWAESKLTPQTKGKEIVPDLPCRLARG